MPARPAIYLDSNAAAPLSPEVSEALLPLLSGFGIPNPSSIRSHGRLSKRLIAEAREKIASSISTDPEQLIFTSSGTEANQLAIRGCLEPALSREGGGRPHWITTPVEHDSVLQMVEWFRGRGGEVSFLPVDADGRAQVSAMSGLWREETKLVSAVWVNNETGVINPVAELASEVRARGGTFHLDAAQAWGKIPFDVESLGAHLVTVSAHKIGGLAGVGLLWVARGTQVQAVVKGKQEKGRRGGTENVLGIVAAGAAAAAIQPQAWSSKTAPLRDRLQATLCARIPGTQVNGGGAPRVAGTLNLSFDGIEGDGLVMALDLAGYSVSSGSACSSGFLEPSHVLMALGRSKAQAMAAIRVSLSGEMEWPTLEGFVASLEAAVARIRKAPEARRDTYDALSESKGVSR